MVYLTYYIYYCALYCVLTLDRLPLIHSDRS